MHVRKEIWGENQTEIQIAPDCFELRLSTNEGTNIQGFHGNHVLVMLAEAPGITAEI
jgi:hypothetical protein